MSEINERILQVCSFRTRTRGKIALSAHHQVNLFLRGLRERVPSATVKEVSLSEVNGTDETWGIIMEMSTSETNDFTEYLNEFIENN